MSSHFQRGRWAVVAAFNRPMAEPNALSWLYGPA